MEMERLGYLVVITGPMFSGKTTLLIRELLTAKQVNPETRILVINHQLDQRNGGYLSPHQPAGQVDHHVVERHGITYQQARDLTSVDVEACDMVAIDEAQFFDDLVPTVHRWLQAGLTVYCAGLTLDYRNQNFGHLLELVPHADQLHTLRAVCVRCLQESRKLGFNVPHHTLSNAIYSRRLSTEDDQCLVGADKYQPVCRYHFYQ